MSSPITTLSFVSDDYGEAEQTDRRIENLAQHGLVKNITVVGSKLLKVTGFHESPTNLGLTWGAHLFLTGYPLLSSNLCSFARSRGGTLDKRTLLSGLLRGVIRIGDIAAEFEAQLQVLMRHGFVVRFLDTHQNIHMLPPVYWALRRVATAHGLAGRIRPTVQIRFSLKQNARTVLSMVSGVTTQSDKYSRVLVGCPGYKCDVIDLEAVRIEWATFLAQLRLRNYSEIVVPVHPGLSPAEMAIYSDPELLELLSCWGTA